MTAPEMTPDEWVEAAVQAAVDQGFEREVTDPDVLDAIADILATAPAPAHADDAATA
jgi:hypothetical protein